MENTYRPSEAGAGYTGYEFQTIGSELLLQGKFPCRNLLVRPASWTGRHNRRGACRRTGGKERKLYQLD